MAPPRPPGVGESETGWTSDFRTFGADLAMTYRNEKAKKFVEPLAKEPPIPLIRTSRTPRFARRMARGQ